MKVYASENPAYVFKKVLDMNLKGRRVLIKPNLVNDMPSTSGVTTDLKLVRQLIAYLKRKGARVLVGEYSIEDTQSVFDKLKVNELPCKVINLKKDKWIKVKSRTGLVFKELFLPEAALNADLIISFAKLKTHSLTTVTLSIKNLFGLFNRGSRSKAHIKGLNESIIDILSCFNRKKVIGFVDGVIALDGKFGPIKGTPRRVGLVVGSKDLLSCDSFCAELMGANPRKITHLRLCAEKGLGEIDYKLIGVGINDYRQSFNLPLSFFYLGSKLLRFYRRKKPYLKRPDKCVKCLSCINNCPVKAVSMNNNVSFNYEKCIECMVCLESCKYGALSYDLKFPASIIHPFYKFLRNLFAARRMK